VALLLVSASLMTYDYLMLRQNTVREIQTIADIVGTGLASKITGTTRPDTLDLVSLLERQNHIMSAVVFDANGRVLEEYKRPGIEDFVRPEVQPPGEKFEGNSLNVYHEVKYDRSSIGTVYIKSNLNIFQNRIKRYALIFVIVFLLTITIVSGLIARLQRIVSAPILKLAAKVKQVSEEKDLTLRADINTSDEIGYLSLRFNEMLDEVERRDNDLRSTQEKLMQHASELEKSESRFRDLFDEAPDIYLILDTKGKILDINNRGVNLLGYLRNSIINQSIFDILHNDDHNCLRLLFDDICRLGRTERNFEGRLLHLNGDNHWVSSQVSVIRAHDSSRVTSIRVIFRDITEERRLRAELERAQRLETAGQIAGQIAHDFNNLLGPLAAYPILIREELPDKHPAVDMLIEMERAAQKIADINQQLFALGRRGHYTKDIINLNELINSLVLTQPIFHDADIRLNLGRNLLNMKGGSAQLSRAVTNLMINAIEAIQTDTGSIWVRTENVYLDKVLKGYQSIERGEYVCLTISDNGTGIARKHLDKIFDPFFTTKRMDRMRGSGLGLSVVHGIVKDHRGYITVQTIEGKGTEFSLYFPVCRSRQELQVTRQFEIRGGRESILIVDDDPMQQRVASQLLHRLGYEIHTVDSGEEAIDYVKSKPQDLLLLDMVMDGIDGTETYRQILEISPAQRAIVLSGFAKSKRVQEALELGAGGFITKPVSLNILASAVRKELDTKRLG
jgi:PAS domain S-box-containing protein